MQAIILAGGSGLRLRPLTETIPKPMLPVAGVPALERIVLDLARSGFSEAIITTNYMAGHIAQWLRERPLPLPVRCVEEGQPLGTAGCVKNCLDQLDDEFLIIQGDGVAEIDYGAFLNFHSEHQAEVSIAAMRVQDTREFGILETGADGAIARFQEKPAPEEAFSNLANAGFYLLHKRVFDEVPSNEPHDFSRQLFPRLMRQGARFFAWELNGYWRDIGRVENYLDANRHLLHGQIVVTPDARVHPSATLVAPCLIGARANIGARCVLGPGTVVDADCDVAPDCRLESSVLHPGVRIGRGAQLRDCVVAGGALLEEKVVVEPSSVVGAQSLIGAGARIESDSRIAAFARVPSGSVVSGDFVRAASATPVTQPLSAAA